MASSRFFNDAASQYLTQASALGLTDYPITMACWFKTDAGGNETMMSLGDASRDDTYMSLRTRDPADSDVLAYVNDTGTAGFASTSTQYSNDTWHLIIAVYENDTSRKVYLDGAGEGTDATDLDFGGMDLFRIGCHARLTPATFMSGNIALAAVWNKAFDGTDIAALWNSGDGALPPSVQNGNLVAYYFDGTEVDTDHKGSYDLTPVNAPTWDSGDWPIAGAATGTAGQSIIDVIAHTLAVSAIGNIGVSQAIIDVIPFTTGVLAAANVSPSQAIIEVVPFTHSVVGHASASLSQGITEVTPFTHSVTGHALASLSQGITEVTPFTLTAGAATVAAITQAIVDVIPFTQSVLGDANASLSQAITEIVPFTVSTQYDFVQAITQAVIEIVPFTVTASITTPAVTAAITQAAINIAPYTVGVSVGEWIEALTKEVLLVLSRQANVRLDESTSQDVTITEGREVIVKL